MNNKDYINKMAERLQMSPKEVQQLTTSFVNELAERMEDGSILSVQGFGNFEVKKKMERILINPTTKQRMLIPPKLALTFKPGITLKEKLK
jgi:DNA-binding protein HU-beta